MSAPELNKNKGLGNMGSWLPGHKIDHKDYIPPCTNKTTCTVCCLLLWRSVIKWFHNAFFFFLRGRVSGFISSFFCCFFWPHHMTSGISVPWPVIEPVPPALAAQGLNHWTQGNSYHALFIWFYLSLGREKLLRPHFTDNGEWAGPIRLKIFQPLRNQTGIQTQVHWL